MRAAIYLRVSLDSTGEQLAVTRQREDCLEIVQGRGWSVAEEYVDNSISASSRTKVRPAYDRMVGDFAAGRFDALVCWDLDRLTRQPRQLEDWIDAAEERGLVLVTANGEADLSTDAGRLFARIKASVARAEVERKGARQRRAMAQRVENGRVPAGVRLTGYAPDGTVVEGEAELIRELFARFNAGESLHGLARWLTDTGVPTRRGAPWRPSSVRTILTNARYCGRQVYKGEATGQLGDWDPIVTEAAYDAAQAILTDPRRIANREGTDRKHLGSGIYRCAVCGDRLVAHSTPTRYRCRDGAHVTRSAGPVDEYVEAVVVAWLNSIEELDLSPADDTPTAGEVARHRERLRKVELDYDNDLIDGRRYAVKREKVLAELKAAERAHRQSRSSAALGGILASSTPGDAFLAAPLGIRRTILDEFLEVRLHAAPRGRRTFDPSTVELIWRSPAT